LATWSEIRGAHQVNELETNMTIDELARGSTRLQRTGRLVRQTLPMGMENVELGDTLLSLPNEELYAPCISHEESRIISSWPVLKSTHDFATLSEKRGKDCVNDFRSCYEEKQQPDIECTDLNFSDTPLACPNEPLLPSSSQPIEHRVLSCGPVLKSTHDMANWYEKGGPMCVNTAEANEVLDEMAQTTPPYESEVPLAPPFISRPKGNWRRANQWPGMENLELGDTPLAIPNEPLIPQTAEPICEHKILQTWTVLKSTHDDATWSEKSGEEAVNTAQSSMTIDDMATDQTPENPISMEGMMEEGIVVPPTYIEGPGPSISPSERYI